VRYYKLGIDLLFVASVACGNIAGPIWPFMRSKAGSICIVMSRYAPICASKMSAHVQKMSQRGCQTKSITFFFVASF
jgi:hypothetical protein